MGGACSTNSEKIMHTGFRWKYRRKETLERPKRMWKDDVKMGLRETGCGDMNWIDLAQDRDRWRVLVNKPVPITGRGGL
jgi:hypothetical protein